LFLADGQRNTTNLIFDFRNYFVKTLKTIRRNVSRIKFAMKKG